MGDGGLLSESNVTTSPSAGSIAVQSAGGTDTTNMSPEELLRARQRQRRMQRVEIIKRKRAGELPQSICSSVDSICSSSSDVHEAAVEIPSHLTPMEIRKLKNRLSAERSRNKKTWNDRQLNEASQLSLSTS